MILQQAQQWMYDHANLYGRPSSLGTQKDNFFKVYNILTGSVKKPTSCGRCLAGMRLQLQDIKKELDSMQKFEVFRTEKGNLTFKETEESAYTIHAKNKTAANEALKQLKKDDKQFYGQ